MRIVPILAVILRFICLGPDQIGIVTGRGDAFSAIAFNSASSFVRISNSMSASPALKLRHCPSWSMMRTPESVTLIVNFSVKRSILNLNAFVTNQKMSSFVRFQ